MWLGRRREGEGVERDKQKQRYHSGNDQTFQSPSVSESI